MDRHSQEQLDNADYGLADESVSELNRDFYSLEPAAYFRYRLRNLLLSAGRGHKLQEMLAHGVEVGDLKVGDNAYVPHDELSAHERQDQHAFVVLETEVLLHHVAETLLRLYLAHEGSPSCPWLSMARERSFGRFKERVELLKDEMFTPERQAMVTTVFLGTSDRQTFDTIPDEDAWRNVADNAAQWLHWFATYILDGNVYNAAKHGLGVWPQNSALKVEIDGLADFLNGSGPCLEFLHTRRNSQGRNQWHRTTKWIRIDRSLGCIHVACQLIQRLWSVAGIRHGDRESFELELKTFPSPSTMLGDDEMTLATLSRTLGYYDDAVA